MGQNSNIEWTDHTFNPWIGCQKVGPGCDHCYAEAYDKRFDGGRWGPHAARTRTSRENWAMPLRWNDLAAGAAVRPKVFCASLADVFDNHASVLTEWRLNLFALIEHTPNLDWLLLTKRPQNIKAMLPRYTHQDPVWPNVWLGCTVVNQDEAERDIPHLLANPARVHFLSVEPMLGPIVLGSLLTRGLCPTHDFASGFCAGHCPDRNEVGWVICGGESGTEARPMKPQWARDLRDECAAAGKAFFFKQWGEWVSVSEVAGPGRHYRFEDGATVRRTGRVLAGRTLDGVTHDRFPVMYYGY